MRIRTDKQRQSSRINGAQSAGPRTPEGKAISSKNATKYGICVSDATFYLDPKATSQLNQLRTEYFDFYLPRTPVERDCLEEVILCLVRLDRLHHIEEGVYAEGRERAFATESILGPDGKPIYRYDLSQYPPEEQPFVANMHVAAAWRPANDVFETLSRQETRLSNRLRRAQNRFDVLFAGRRQPQPASEPEPAPQPEPPPPPDPARPAPAPAPGPSLPQKIASSNEPEPKLTPVLPAPASHSSPDPEPKPAPGKEAA